MTDCIDVAWLDARITRTKQQIEELENAIDALAGGALSYSMDTGQTRQSVTRQQLGSLRLMLDSLYNRLSTLCARRNGASSYGTPGF